MASLSANSRRNTSPVSTILKDQCNTDTDEVVVKADPLASNESTGIVENIVRRPANGLKDMQWQSAKSCNERSDSGFSETPYMHTTAVDYQASNQCIEEEPIEMPPVAEEQKVQVLEKKPTTGDESASKGNVSKMGKTKSMKEKSTKYPKSEMSMADIAKSTPNIAQANNSKSSKDNSTANVSINRTQSLQCRKATIDKDMVRKSDFTNTIQMRKKSLENSVFKERMSVSRTILKPTGKVLNLLQKFALEQKQTIPKSEIDDSLALRLSDDVVDFRISLSQDKLDQDSGMLDEFNAVNTDMVNTTTANIEVSNGDNDVSRMSASSSMKPKHRNDVDVPSVFKRLSTNKTTVAGKVPKSPSKQIKTENITNRIKLIAAEGNSNKIGTNGSASTKSSSTPFNRASSLRLSARVKEVTERLSAPKSPKSKEVPPIKIATPKSPKISKDKYRQYRNLFNANENKIKWIESDEFIIL